VSALPKDLNLFRYEAWSTSMLRYRVMTLTQRVFRRSCRVGRGLRKTPALNDGSDRGEIPWQK